MPLSVAAGRFHPYAPRSIRFHGVREHAGWRVKEYAIAYGAGPLDWAAFRGGIRLAFEALPTPAVTVERPGVAFLIAHRGRGAAYVVLGWWDRENELPMRVFVKGTEREADWRAALGSESVCVWDLQVIAAEREAYVDAILSGSEAGPSERRVAAYLRRHFGPAEWQAHRAAYDDDQRLTDYVLTHYPQLLSEEERILERTLEARLKSRGTPVDDLRRTWLSWEEAIQSPLLRDGPDAFRRRIRERLLREHTNAIEIARCEGCDKILASPKAKQCLWCGRDWHPPLRSS